MIFDDIRSFFGRLPGLFRNDFAAVMLVIANIVPVVDMMVKGKPGSSGPAARPSSRAM